MNTKVAVIVLSLLVLGGTSVVLSRAVKVRTEAFAEAHAQLLFETNTPRLRVYIRCGFQATCRQRFGEKAGTGEPFPVLLGLLWLGGLGGTLGGLFMRDKTQLYDGALALLKDVKDLRVRFWLTNPKAGHGILLGRHVTVPDSGPERRPTLRGERGCAVDKQLMVLSPGYGKRRELPSLAVLGTSRSGKSLQLTAQILRWQGSGVYLDIKGELYRRTAGLKARRSRVFVLSPSGKGNQFDALAELMTDDNDVTTAANIIAAPHLEKGDGVFFAQKASQGLTAAFKAARVEGVPPLDMLHEIILKGGIGSYIERLRRHDDPSVRLALNTFLDPHGGADLDLSRIVADKGLASSYSTMTARLGPFLTPGVRHLFRKSDFKAHEMMGKEPCTVYVQWPEATIESSLAVYDLVMTGFLRGMIRHVDVTLNGEAPTTPVFMGLDEIYKAPIINLPGDLSTAAGRDIVIALYCQTLGQLRAAFGQGGSETILDNCAVKLFYKTEGPEVAQYISSLAHKVSRTEERHTRRWSIVPEMPTVSEGNQSREVIAPDEVILVGGKDRELLIAAVTGKPLMIVKRVDLRDEPRLTRLMNKYRAPPIKRASEHELYPDIAASARPQAQQLAAARKGETGAGTAEPVGVVQPQNGALSDRIRGAVKDLEVTQGTTRPPRFTQEGRPSQSAQPAIAVEERELTTQDFIDRARLAAAAERAEKASRNGETRAP